MRIYILLFFILGGCIFQLQAQTDSLIYNFGDSTAIDVQPEFPGGEMGFNKFIQTHIIYPEDARKAGLQGTIYVSFIIEKDGSLSTIKPLQGIYFSSSCEKATMDILLQSPQWKPGLKNGVPIRTRKIIRTKFTETDAKEIAVTCNGQRFKKINESNDTTLFNHVSNMPAFRTANGSLYAFIQTNLVYPADAKEKKITGSVIVSFVVEKDGSVLNAQIVPGKGLYPSCDQAALDLVSEFPAWIPGDHKGTYVRVKQMVRISFE
ncbi:MAG TPA: energy transducer TonB [Cytophaga sp.]|jgi:TonB family protein|nr:energy transducer TonB [Cytophaga sp.]